MKFYYTYILKSQKDGTLYTGSTNDLRKRLKQHNAGNSVYTIQKVDAPMISFITRHVCQKKNLK